jgi:hypothetical protein
MQNVTTKVFIYLKLLPSFFQKLVCAIFSSCEPEARVFLPHGIQYTTQTFNLREKLKKN